MSSYRQILYHIVFATDKRKPTLDERYCSDLYQYIVGIAKHRNTRIYQVNGVADHIHILCDLHPSVSLGDFVKEIKCFGVFDELKSPRNMVIVGIK